MATPPPINVTINVGSAGATPTPPVTIWNTLINYVSASDPGYTILPGALIEDIASTDVAAIAQCDAAAVDAINALNPLTSNQWLLTQWGNLVGVPQGIDTNTSVFVVFSGTVGFPVQAGFTVSDGSHQYRVQSPGGIVQSGGTTAPLLCVATVAGTWAVPPGTVTSLITSLPGGITLTCTNPSAGTPQQSPQSESDYRAQVTQAMLVGAQGTQSFVKTLIGKIPGVQPRLISIQLVSGDNWMVMVGGSGDPYAIAYAIYAGLADLADLVASTINITAITKANPGVVTTGIAHGLTTGQTGVVIAGVLGMTAANGSGYTATKIDDFNFSFGVNTSAFGTYTSGGVVTPNARNQSINIIDSPDTYAVPFVVPLSQAVTVQLTWNTNSPNFVSSTAVAQLGAPAIVSYINSIPVGQPINEFELNQVFQEAIASILPGNFLSRLLWTISIDGVAISPTAGTGLVQGDTQSYLTATTAAVTITQG